MARLTIAVVYIAMLAMVLGGCAFFSIDAKGRSQATQPPHVPEDKEKTLDDQFVEVARRVPAFGGMFINKDGQLAVYLLDPSQKAAVEAAIASIFGPERIPPGGILVLPGQYGFLQLKEWHDRLGPVLEIPGITLTDIDEANNRLKVGVEKIEKRSLVEPELSKLGIPREAVIIEEAGPIIPVPRMSP